MSAELIYNLPDDVYHRLPAVGSTVLAQLDRGGDYLQDYLNTDHDGDHFIFGTAVHLALLQTKKFEDYIVPGPAGINDKRKSEWKRFVKELAPDEIGLTEKEYDEVLSCVRAVLENEHARLIIDSTKEYEVTATWFEAGIQCKGRFDILNPSLSGIFDIKTTSRGVTSDRVRYSVREYRYNIQGAHYIAGARAAGLNIETYGLIFIDKSTCKCRVYELSEATLERAEERRQKLLSWYGDNQNGKFKSQYEIEVIDI